MTQPKNFALVQALRGIAAMWVVLFHANEGHHIDGLQAALPKWLFHLVFELGDNGVAIFFALSGFVIAHSIRDAAITPSFIGRFALRRSIRLDPPYWASMVFVIALAWLSASVKGESFAAPPSDQIAAHIMYLQVILGYASINAVYWTLTYEIQFYLVLVLAVGLAQRFGAIVFAPLMLIALLWGTGAVIDPMRPGLFVSLWHCFFLGVLAYWAKDDRIALIALVILAATVITINQFNFTSAMTALGLYAASRTRFLHEGLNWRWLQFLGTISYSLYLTHNPVTGASFFVVARLPEWLSLPLTVAACVATATVFWWLLERPSQALAKSISSARLREPAFN